MIGFADFCGTILFTYFCIFNVTKQNIKFIMGALGYQAGLGILILAYNLWHNRHNEKDFSYAVASIAPYLFATLLSILLGMAN